MSEDFNEIMKLNKCTQTFVSLDAWLQDAASKEGKNVLQSVRDAFHNDVRANISYYEETAAAYESDDQKLLAAKYRLIGKMYESFLVSQ